MGVCILGAFAGHAWARTQPWFAGATMEGALFHAVLANALALLLLLAASDTPRALGLDGSGAFLLTKPRAHGWLLLPLVVMVALHVVVGFGGVLVVGSLAPRPIREPAQYLLLLWCVVWAGALGAVVAEQRHKVVWVPVAVVSVAMCCLAFAEGFGGWDGRHLLKRLGLVARQGQIFETVALCTVIGLPIAVSTLVHPSAVDWRRRGRSLLIGLPILLWLLVPVWQDVAGNPARYGLERRTEADPIAVDRALARVAAAAAEDRPLGEVCFAAQDAFKDGFRGLRRSDKLAHGSWRDFATDAEMQEAVLLALAHPDPRVGDAVSVFAWSLAPERALAALRREGVDAFPPRSYECKDGHEHLGWPFGIFRGGDYAAPARLEFLDELLRQAKTESLRDWVASEYEMLYRVISEPEDREVLLAHIAAWPTWQAGEVVFFAREWDPAAASDPAVRDEWPRTYVYGQKRYLWSELRASGFPTPAWANARPWNHPDATVRHFYLNKLLAFTPPNGLAADLERIVSSVPAPARTTEAGRDVEAGLGLELIWLSMLNPESLGPALEKRWERIPEERSATFFKAVTFAPHVALAWLRTDSQMFAPTAISGYRSWALHELFGRYMPMTSHGFEWAGIDEAHAAAIYRAWPDPTGEQVAQLVLEMQVVNTVWELSTIGQLLEAATGEAYGWDARAWADWVSARSPVGSHT